MHRLQLYFGFHLDRGVHRTQEHLERAVESPLSPLLRFDLFEAKQAFHLLMRLIVRKHVALSTAHP